MSARDNRPVISFGRRIALATVQTDLSAVRLASALRRTAVVMVVMILGRVLVSDQVGVSAGMSALLIGLLDKGPSPRAAWRTMIAGTALLAIVTLVAGVTSGSTIVGVGLMAVLAAAAGVGYSVNPRSTQVLLFAAVMAASYSVRPITPEIALEAMIAVLAAGLLQALATALTGPVIHDWPERRLVIAAARSTRLSLEDVSHRRDGLQASRASSRAIDQAERVLRESDLPPARLGPFWLLVGHIDELRMEARGLSGRSRLAIPQSEDARTRQALAMAGSALESAVNALARRFTAAQAECRVLDQRATALSTWVATADVASPWAGATVARCVAGIAEEVRTIVDRPVIIRVARRREPLRSRLRDAFARGSGARRVGARLAGAAIVGEVVGLALGLDYASWAAVTSMMVLRPDTGPTLPRIVMRAVGASLGVVGVVLLMTLGPDSIIAIMSMIAILVGCVYTLAAVNNAVMVGLMTALAISLLSMGGRDPQALATARVLDVVVGCIVGTAFAVAVPIWTRDRVPASIRSYALASADYFATLAAMRQCSGPEEAGAGSNETRIAARSARSAGRSAEADMKTGLLEPGARRVDIGQMAVLAAWIQRSNEAGVAAEVGLRHGEAIDDIGRERAREAERRLRAAAAALDPAGVDGGIGEPSADERDGVPDSGGDATEACLARAARCAAAAQRAAMWHAPESEGAGQRIAAPGRRQS